MRVSTEDVTVDQPDPATYDYTAPTQCCDVVMKGGITSGVVYPFAVCEIARSYRFRSIGGTSAGAIAAAATAAAEYGREKGGFAKLARLPGWLGAGANLFELFQPQPETKAMFRVCTAPIGADRKVLRFVTALVENSIGWFILGALPGAVAMALFLAQAQPLVRVVGGALGLLILLLGGLFLAVWKFYRAATRRIAANGFGLCSGMGEPGPGSGSWDTTPVKPLTEWLAALIDDLAGNDPHTRRPLTFGDLWGGGVAGEPAINLHMMTTSLTHGRPYQLPFGTDIWFFDPVEFRKRFPERVVAWMERHPRRLPRQPARRRRERVFRRLMKMQGLCPMPEARRLPVVVAARLSLSFPLLISAVPLNAVDWSLPHNIAAAREWTRWARHHRAELPRLLGDPDAWEAVEKPGAAPRAAACWFSDGGITSNFPVHFFDAPIPRWPTFAINLRTYPQGWEQACDECDPSQAPCSQEEGVWMPRDNRGGILELWRPGLEAGPGLKPLVTFGHSVLDTMQNWTDNTQLRVPGYRDRVAHVYHTREEGGINLNMPACRITALTKRGRIAGRRLAARFTVPAPEGEALTWDNHRWVRYRTTMLLLQDTFRRFRRAWEGPGDEGEVPCPRGGGPSYEDLLAATSPPSYPLGAEQPFAIRETARLVAMSADWDADGAFGERAPRPLPELRIRPRV
jgi:hypothetical protein